MRKKRRRPGERPIWAPRHVDSDIEHIHPVQGKVILKEIFLNRTSGELFISEEWGTKNTLTAYVLKVHPETSEEFGFNEGDRVIFKEWSGGRWAFQGMPVLITEAENILAQVI